MKWSKRMKAFISSLMILSALLVASNTQAASIYAGQATAAAVCSQCHGVRKQSQGSVFPNLAGKDASYLKTALKQYRDKTRLSEVMNNIAASLSDKDISNVASYYARLKP
jgi:cytochrome c553